MSQDKTIFSELSTELIAPEKNLAELGEITKEGFIEHYPGDG